ncbi:MAG: FecR domain-containing protein [Vicinamibacterales bacterium]
MATNDSEHDAEVRALLRQAAAAGQVDAGRAARVRAAVHAEWKGSRPRRRVLPAPRWIAAAAAAGVVLAVVMARPWDRVEPAPPLSSAPPLAAVRYVAGSVTGLTGAGATPAPLRVGDALTAGAEITIGAVGPNGSQGAMLALADGVEVRVAAGTELALDGPGRLDLRRGAIYVDTSPRAGATAPTPIEVRSGGSVIRDVGTRFVVHGGTTVVVAVRDGQVQLERDGADYSAGPGQAIEVTPGGRVAVSEAPAYGPRWDWIVGAAPPQPVDGRTLADFLAWVEREGGRTVRFADAAVGAAADRTLVYGRIDGLTVDEALAVVLPSCGLAHRVDGGVITIEAGDDARPRR